MTNTANTNRGWASLMMAAVGAVVVMIATLTAASKPAEAAFPGTNGKIAFASTRDGNTEIYMMRADGTGPRRLTRNLGYGDRSPAWSPDGKKIAFTSTRGYYEIYRMSTNGAAQTRLTFSAANNLNPTWQLLPR